MTVSMETTRLSSVITGCGGKDTTCSRRSIMYLTLSTNGTTMFSPAGRVPLYLPNRSTIPARACGTMRTVLASTTAANSTINKNSTSTATGTVFPHSFSCGASVQLGDLVHESGGAPDLEDVDLRARLDHGVLVVRSRGPDLAVDPPLSALRGDLREHQPGLA